jgi:hypothetical protein
MPKLINDSFFQYWRNHTRIAEPNDPIYRSGFLLGQFDALELLLAPPALHFLHYPLG